ncbi:MAG TPA: hypothetical protein VLX68_04505 [Chitinivibrionales bacterium]|nr:hypothetical protein [Chitinivibrionales bacterium]
MNKLVQIILPLTALVLVSCVKQVTKQTMTLTQGHDIVKVEKGDTTAYVVSFQDSLERKRFSNSLEKLLKDYPFKRDTLVQNRFFKLQLSSYNPCPSEAKVAPAETLKAIPAPVKEEKIEPRIGGSVTMYLQRGFVDQNMSALISCYPFNNDACPITRGKETAGYFQVKSVSDREITLVLGDKAANSAGKALTSFDCVNAWSAFVKRHPAEGTALFRNVKGLSGFIHGQEAIIAGFQVVDQKTISLHFDPADPLALARMCTPRALPASFKMGPYAVKSDNAGTVILAPNSRFPGTKGYLSTCVLKLGKDANPILSYSVGNYDIMSLFSLKDLDFARRKALEQSNLIVSAEDRYFVSCNLEPKELRQAVRKAIDGRDMFVNFVKAEGGVITAIESDSAAPAAVPAVPQPPKQSAPCSVLYRSDDPVSDIVAEKIVADLTRGGIQCALKAATQEEYEAALASKDYGICVGWVPKSAMFDQSERLRLSSIWFNDVIDEQARIADCREIPLFWAREYFLCKKKIAFAGDAVEGIFIKE